MEQGLDGVVRGLSEVEMAQRRVKSYVGLHVEQTLSPATRLVHEAGLLQVWQEIDERLLPWYKDRMRPSLVDELTEAWEDVREKGLKPDFEVVAGHCRARRRCWLV